MRAAATVLAALWPALAAPGCPAQIELPGDALVPVEDGYVVVSFPRAREGASASVRALRLEGGPAVDRVYEEPWPASGPANPDYEGQLWMPAPAAIAGRVGPDGAASWGADASLRLAGRESRAQGTPDALAFEGDVPLGADDLAVGVEWSAYASYPGAPPWGLPAGEQHELLWCPVAGPCVSWREATRGAEPRVYCVDELPRRGGGRREETRWELRACPGDVVPLGLRVERSADPPSADGLVRTSVRLAPGEALLLEPPAREVSIRWHLATRDHDEYADGRREPVAGCTGGVLRVRGIEPGCSWSDEVGYSWCPLSREVRVGPEQEVEVDLWDGSPSGFAVTGLWVEADPGVCLAALAGAPQPGSGQSLWSRTGPRWPSSCDLADCQTDPPARVEYSYRPLRCEGGACRALPEVRASATQIRVEAPEVRASATQIRVEAPEVRP